MITRRQEAAFPLLFFAQYFCRQVQLQVAGFISIERCKSNHSRQISLDNKCFLLFIYVSCQKWLCFSFLLHVIKFRLLLHPNITHFHLKLVSRSCDFTHHFYLLVNASVSLTISNIPQYGYVRKNHLMRVSKLFAKFRFLYYQGFFSLQ